MNTSRDSEPGAFARRLNELREASGRSYGALARRVGVSASTLHRYCSGHTVPMEFAPIERLARLCGVGGEDLVALHRLWILADADRRRRQEAATGPAAQSAPRVPSDAPDPSGHSGAAHRTSTSHPGNTPGARDTSAPLGGAMSQGHDTAGDSGGIRPPADGAGKPAAPWGTGTCAAGESTRSGGPADATRSPHDPPPDGGAGPEVTVVLGEGRGAKPPPAGRRPAGTARRPWRRRRLAYGAGVVASLLTFVLLVAFDHSPLRPGDGRRAAAQQPGVGGTGSPTPGARGTASARPASPSASPSGTPSAAPGSGGGRRAPGVTPSRSAGAPKSRGTGTPFTVRVNQHVWANGCDHGYLVDRAPAAVPPPPGEADAAPWARAVGAVHSGRTGVRITVQGRTDEAVVLQGLRVRVAARRAPAPGNVYQMSLGCGGSLTPRMFDVNLDKSRPIARSVSGHDENGPLPAVAFPYRVSARDPEILLVTATTAGCDCDWYLELEWSSGDRSGTVRVDDGGRPFRTSGVGGRTSYAYDTGTGRWITDGPSPRSDTGTDGGTDTGTGTPARTRTGDGGTDAGPVTPAS
ncbi:helix-turn-helix domain-containing protein [Streptomyces sp. NPDC004609]|uniref:helix-turn-helix domain-containing protein n=1 Tax=Streptomyces sp. NPDC004609 TaxID=3364704 RepID=UPI0036C38110